MWEILIKNFTSPDRPYDTDSAICCPNHDNMAIGRYPFLNSDENGLGNSMLLCLLTVAWANTKQFLGGLCCSIATTSVDWFTEILDSFSILQLYGLNLSRARCRPDSTEK